MKKVYSKKMKAKIIYPETSLEAVEQLQNFFESDMWYSLKNEWKSENDMLKYLKGHFNICKKQIRGIMKNEN